MLPTEDDRTRIVKLYRYIEHMPVVEFDNAELQVYMNTLIECQKVLKEWTIKYAKENLPPAGRL